MIQCKPHSFPADIWSFAICLIEMANRKPPNRKTRIKAMFITATDGLESFVREQKYSSEFKDFLLRCLKLVPEERETPSQLLSHTFLDKAASERDMEDILKDIFLQKVMEESGIFG
jgi:serine/threonine protein kinase